MKRLRWLLTTLLILSIAAGVYFYAVPRMVGDQFASAFIRVDVEQMESLLCDVQDFGAVRQQIAGAGGQLTGLIGGLLSTTGAGNGLADAVHHEAAYYAFTGDYVFQLVLDGSVDAGIQLAAGLRSPEITLHIQRDGLEACVGVD